MLSNVKVSREKTSRKRFMKPFNYPGTWSLMDVKGAAVYSLVGKKKNIKPTRLP
jgi:hypothetical protein